MNLFSQKFPMIEEVVDVEIRFLVLQQSVRPKETHLEHQEIIDAEFNLRQQLWKLSIPELQIRKQQVEGRRFVSY